MQGQKCRSACDRSSPGDLTAISGRATYSWDARDHMTGASVIGGSATFAYDDMGQRTQQRHDQVPVGLSLALRRRDSGGEQLRRRDSQLYGFREKSRA